MEGHAAPPAEGGPPEPQGTHLPAPNHPTALPVHGGSPRHGAAVAGPRHPHPKSTPTSRRRTCLASSDASSAPSTTSGKRTHTSWSRCEHPPDNPRARTAETTPPHRHMHLHWHRHAQVSRESARARLVPEPAPSSSLLTGPSIRRPTPQPRAPLRPPQPSPLPSTPQPPPPQPLIYHHHHVPVQHSTPRAAGETSQTGTQKTRPHRVQPRRRQGPRHNKACARSPAETQDRRQATTVTRQRAATASRNQTQAQAQAWRHNSSGSWTPPRTYSTTLCRSHCRSGGSSAKHSAYPPSPTPPPPPSWRGTPRLKRDALRPATSQSPHPRPTDHPQPDQNSAKVHQQRLRPPTNPRCQPRYSKCPATAPTTSPNPAPRQRPCARNRESTSPSAPAPLAPQRHRTTRNPPGPPLPPVPTAPSHPPTPTPPPKATALPRDSGGGAGPTGSTGSGGSRPGQSPPSRAWCTGPTRSRRRTAASSHRGVGCHRLHGKPCWLMRSNPWDSTLATSLRLRTTRLSSSACGRPSRRQDKKADACRASP